MRFAMLGVFALLLGPSLSPHSSASMGSSSEVIAIIDTGILPTHVAFAPGQVVAWYDFSNHTPRSNQTSWDPLVATPYDNDGHGTAVASVAAGLPHEALQPNFSPGAPLAVANVYVCSRAIGVQTAYGGCGMGVREISDGLRWAVGVVHARVIVLSAASFVASPFVESRHWTEGELRILDSIAYARAHGALVVLAAGNGEGNTGTSTDMSWMHFPQVSPDVLIVGGATSASTGCVRIQGGICGPNPRGIPGGMASLDPVITANETVNAACTTSDSCFGLDAGTSVSSPLAASLAYHLLLAAEARQRTLTVDELEWLVKQSVHPWISHDPQLEGYGFVDGASAERGEAILDGAPGPSGDDWDYRVWYVEEIREQNRALWFELGKI